MSELIDKIVTYRDRTGDHRALGLTPEPLERIVWYFTNYFAGKEPRSAETGCGASTIVFAEHAASHTAYCIDDSECTGSSVRFACDFPSFRHERVRWIYGPTQRTVFAEPPDRPVDFILLDGPHGYPFPELEYVALYKWLLPDGILVIDDIHIPTINNFYNFLLQDDGFRSHGVVGTTAFLQRSRTPPFNMEGDDWWLQRYNVQRFPAVSPNFLDAGLHLPVKLAFDRTRAPRAAALTRGFSTRDCPPFSEGDLSTVELRLAGKIPERLRIQLDIEPVAVPEREGSVRAVLNAQEVGFWPFTEPGRRTLECEGTINNDEFLRLDLWNHGLKPGNDLKDWVKTAPIDARLPNFRLHSITITESGGHEKPNTLRRSDGCVVNFNYEGQGFSFFVDQDDDSIQIFHTLGRFYEQDELELLRGFASKRGPTSGMSVLDVGAHVGNHTVYFAKVMRVRRVVPVEPNPRTEFLLRTNCALNNAGSVDFTYLGRALGSRTTRGSLVTLDTHNSGGATLRLDGGEVSVHRGDELFDGEHFDIIKIDVEGMELDVLAGLGETIERDRPLIFVEVKEELRDQFLEIVEQLSYDVAWEGQMYPRISNVLLEPRSDARRGGESAVNSHLHRLSNTGLVPSSQTVAQWIRGARNRVIRRVAHMTGAEVALRAFADRIVESQGRSTSDLMWAVLDLAERKKIDEIAAVDKGMQILLSLKYKELLHQTSPLPSLADVEFRSYSQNGEDGILLYIFSLIGTTNKKVVEICASMGLECNAANLILNHKWIGLLFDGDEQQIQWGIDFYNRNKDTNWYKPKLVQAWITAENVNELISSSGFAGEIDLLSLDLDGMDYWIWKAIDCVRPRVVVLEYNWIWGTERSVTIPYDAQFFNADPVGRNGGNGNAYFGASLPAFVKLARTKGYRLIGTEGWGFNAFFVRDDIGQDVLPEVDAAECFKTPIQSVARHARILDIMDPAWKWVEV